MMWSLYVSPKMYMLSPNPQHDGIKRWGLWEVTGALIKETLESLLALLPCEETKSTCSL